MSRLNLSATQSAKLIQGHQVRYEFDVSLDDKPFYMGERKVPVMEGGRIALDEKGNPKWKMEQEMAKIVVFADEGAPASKIVSEIKRQLLEFEIRLTATSPVLEDAPDIGEVKLNG